MTRFQGFPATPVFSILPAAHQERPAQLNQTTETLTLIDLSMKKPFALILTATILLSANAFGADAVYNNRGQIIGHASRPAASVATSASKVEAAPKKQLIYNNRHQLIGTTYSR